MKYTEEQISQLLTYADPVTAASIRARLILIHSLETLTTELRNSSEVIGGIIDDMSRSAAELKAAVDRL